MEKTNGTYDKEKLYLLYLIKCSLHNVIPDEKPIDCSWKLIKAFADFNSVTSMISPAIKKYVYDIPADIRKELELEISSTLYRIAMFDMEREAFMREASVDEICFLPLKGIKLSEYYPVAGMRWMCDNDILYGKVTKAGDMQKMPEISDDITTERLKSVMLKHGFKPESIGGVHDVYIKEPFFNFEMHSRLVPYDSPFADYYTNPWERAIPVEGKKYEFRFSDEDEYIFMVVHAFKHFDSSGCGIRTLVDEYVFLNNKDNMNWKYITEQFKILGLTDFEQRLRTAAQDIFSQDGVISDCDWEMINYMYKCGTYGTTSNRIHRSIDKFREDGKIDGASARKRYLTDRVWINENKMKIYYPFFYRHKWARFTLPFYRMIKGIIVHPKMLWDEWQNIKKYK